MQSIGTVLKRSETAAPASGTDEAAIRAQTTSWAKAYNGGDVKAVAAQYADDALLLAPGAPGVSGRAAILDFFTKDVAGSKAAGVVFNINRLLQEGWEVALHS